MADASEIAIVIASVAALCGAVFAGLRASRCTKIACSDCCTLEREIIDDDQPLAV